MKKKKHLTRIAVGGNNVKHDGDVGTLTAHLETDKLLFNSVLLRPGAKFMTLDLANFCLMIPMKEYEHLRITLKDMPQEIIDEHNLHALAHNDWVCAETRRDAYGLPQTGVLAHDQLMKHLNQVGCSEHLTIPYLWNHKWQPIIFMFVVDDFGIE